MKLIFWNTKGFPEKGFLRYDEVGENPAHNYGSDFCFPDFSLFVEGLGGEQSFDFIAKTEGLG